MSQFMQPGVGGDKFEAASHNGHLLLFFPASLEQNIPTVNGTSDAVTTRIVDLDTGQVLDDAKVWGKAMIPQLKGAIPDGMVLGRLAQGQGKGGNNPPWIIQPHTEQDVPRAEQWLAEGMAEWVAFNVLERLGLDTVVNRRTMATAGIRNHAALVAARLDLETLGNPRGFTVRHLREGSLPTYQLAFLMANYLIARDGFPRVVTYFRTFERKQDRHANFRDTFGQSLEQFELEVLGHLKSVVR